jgi:hypothetical protein
MNNGTANGAANGAAAKLLNTPRTGRYKSNRLPMMVGAPIFGGWGAFNLGWIDIMKRDSQVKLCLGYRKSPLFSAKFMVNAPQPEEKAYVEATYQRFWRKSLRVALRSYDYGYAPAEALYKQKSGRILFDRLKAVHPMDAVPWTVDGQLAFVEVQMPQGSPVRLEAGTTQMPAKGFWIAHDHDWNPWWGHSILDAAWVPWRMKTMPQGAQETVFKWAVKFSMTPLEIRHPHGLTETEDDPEGVNNQDIAMEMIEQIKAGGCIATPSENHPQEMGGGKKWEVIWSKIEGNPQPLLDYAEMLNKEIQRGCGIPDEVITFDQGAGSRARTSVAVGEFYDQAEESLHHIMESFDEQICRPACKLNGFSGEYVVEAMPLLQPDQQQAQQQGMPGQQSPPGQPQPGQSAQQAQMGGGGAGDWISRIGKRGGHQLVNPQTGAVKYGNMSLAGDEAELFRVTFEHTRKLMKRAKRRGGSVNLSRGPDANMLQEFVKEMSRAMNVEQGPRIVVNVPELRQPVIENIINVSATTPDVWVYPEIKVEAPHIPAPVIVQPDHRAEPDKEIKIERNGEGKIVGAKVLVKTI